jgi:hypothetical protein
MSRKSVSTPHKEMTPVPSFLHVDESVPQSPAVRQLWGDFNRLKTLRNHDIAADSNIDGFVIGISFFQQTGNKRRKGLSANSQLFK